MLKEANPELSAEDKREKESLVVIGHTYQPPREFALVSQQEQRADVLASVNESIYQHCYKQVFVENGTEQLPYAGTFSLYGILREWWRSHHPDTFRKLQKNAANTAGKEYRMVGDPYLHPILPLESPANQEMWIKIGLRSFEDDFGFRPKGFWLPETAVNSQTLGLLAKNKIEFVLLRQGQLEETNMNPMWLRTGYGDIAAVWGNDELSARVSFDKETTTNADRFLQTNRGKYNGKISFMSDTELYGEHLPFRDKFLQALSDAGRLEKYGLSPLDVRGELRSAERRFTRLKENSSWSCPHQLGRWTGECQCDSPSWTTLEYKRLLRDRVTGWGRKIDGELDRHGSDWRPRFEDYFLAVKQAMYAKGDVIAETKRLIRNDEVEKLYLAQLARWTAATSCVWFFGQQDRPERAIAELNLSQIGRLLS
jgi:hypothetical protein